MSSVELGLAYRDCRRIAAEHGRTYFLATRLLEPERRPAVHALYAFARMVDDIVDESGAAMRTEHSAEQLDRIENELRGRLVRAPGTCDDRVLLAVSDTILRYSIAPEHFWVFLDSMRMDIPGGPQYRDRYPTLDALREYMRGSAAAIGLQLLPVLGTVVPVAEAEPAAAALGEAFQLTNFLRDIAEDLDRGRIYLPAEELAAFGVDDDLLKHCRDTGRTDPRVRRVLAHLIAINRGMYRHATPGIDLLAPRVRPAIRTAATLYSAILDEIERTDYTVFTHRAAVPRRRRLRVAAREFASDLRRA
ncbi:phytoene/squalene synthase family protein [Nocardia sp. SYP-A9097]|uniref:phytoene/squalene synthase family protein n=1 Tax=Nocardia sp. SYP-A9097 TaxID=2663237 RepID=UPI00129B3569|nr:phytoene/squalene synthase family protein [Nocardia sp. SYP-A9097]MRH92562.1 phytoene/squalene synthase family protein [Nocardia sp. SYP-A9097]